MKRRTNPLRSAKLSKTSPAARLVVAANVAAIFLLGSGEAGAANIYWDNTGTAWGTTTCWSSAAGATSGTPADAVPGIGDVATFSISTITNTNLTAYLGADRSVLGLQFLGTNAGTTTLLGDSTGNTARALTLGASGITVSSSAGAVTIGGTLNNSRQFVNITLGAAQSWTNNSTNALTMVNAVTNGGFLLTLAGSGNIALNGAIAGAGGLTKSGAGTATLSAANTYTGLTTISAGTLALSGSGALAGAVTVDGGTFDLGALSDTVGAVTLTSGSITGTTGVLTGTSFTMNGTGSASAILGGAVALTKSGLGTTTTLSGANTYTGLTTISAGALRAANNAALGTVAGGVSVTAGAALELDGTAGALTIGAEALALNGTGISSGGALRNIAGANSYGGVITLGSASQINSDSGTLTINSAGSITGNFGLTFGGAGNITLADAFAPATAAQTLTKTGAGTLTLSAASTYTGLTTVSEGALTYGIANALSSGAVTVNGGILNVATFSDAVGAVTLTSGSITGSGGTLTGTSFALDGAVDTSVSAILGGASVALTKTGAGTATLSGANTYTGLTTVSAGTLALSGSGALAGAVTVNGGTFNLGTVSDTVGAVTLTSGSITSSTGVLTGTSYTMNGTGSASAILSGAVALTKTGAATTTTLSGVNTFTGVTTLTSGTLSVGTIGDGGAAGNLGAAAVTASNLVFNGGTLQYTGATASTNRNFTLTATTTGTIEVAANTLTMSGASTSTSGALTKAGSGSLVLSGANLYTGLTTISAGALRAANNTALGTVAGGVSVTSGAALELDGTAGALTIGAEALALSGTGISSGGALRNIAGNNSYAGVITLGSAAQISSDSGTLTLNSAGSITGNFGLTFGGAGNITLADAFAPATTAQTLTKTGAGTLTLSVASSYSGATNLEGGTLAFSAANQLGTSSGIVFQTGNGTLKPTADGITLTQAISQGSAGRYDVSTGLTMTLSGLITGAGQLQKVGDGTLVLDNTGNNFSGKPAIFAGTLKLGLGAMTAVTNLDVNGGTLDLNGKTQSVTTTLALGSVALGTAGTISGGGTISAATFSLVSGSISSVLAGTGAVTKSGTETVTLSGTNTYSGVTTLTNGTLSVATIGNGGVAGSLGQATNAAANLVFNGGTLQYTGATASSDRNFTLNDGKTGVFEVSANALTLSGASTATTGGLSKTGSGTLVLSGTNLHTGGVTVSAGTLRATTSTGALGAGILTLSGGALELANDSALAFGRDTTVSADSTITLDRLSSGAGVTYTLGGLTMGAQTLTLAKGSNVASGTAGLTFGTGTTFSGNAAFNVGAGTELSFAQNTTGAVNLSKSGSGALTMAAGGGHADVSVTAGVLNVNHFQGLGTSAGTLSLSSGVTLNNTSGAAVTVGNPKSMSLGGSLTFTGTNNLNLGSGATTLGSALSIDVVAGTLGFNGEIGGAFGLTKSGAGTLQLSGLSGTSSYTGDTTINGGTLELAGTSRFRSGTTINLNTGGTLLVGASASYEGATLVLSGGTLSLQSVVVGDVSYNANSTLSASNANLNGVQTIRSGVTVTMAGDLLGTTPTTATAGRIVIEDTGTLRVTSTATFDMKKGIQLGTATGTAAGSATLSSDASVQLFLPASITGDAALVKTGAGNIRLIGDNSYRGGTVINAGIIGIFSDGSLGLAGTSLKLNNGTIVGASPDTSRSDSGDKTATIGTARSLTLGVGTSNNMDAQTGRTLVYGGVIAEDGAGSAANLRFGNTGTRDGTVILSGANTYSGSSTLVAGTLEVATLANGGVASGIGDASNAASNLVLNAGTLRYSGVSASTDRLFTLGGSATLDTGSGTLAFTNAGSLGSSGSSARTLSLAGSGSGSLAAIVANPDVSFATSLTKTGSGTWALSGINTYTGATNVQNGTLAFSTASALNSSSGLNLGVAATSSAILRYTGGAGTLTPDITILGNGSDTIQNSGTGMLTLTGGLIKNGNALKLDGGTAGLTVMGSITGVVTNLATVGKVSLGAALPEGSALVVGDGSANSTQVVLGTSGSALNLTVSGLSSSGSNNAIVGGNAAAVSTLEVAVASSETTDSFDGVLGGATAESKNLGLKKSGAGTLVLSGSEANTFVGDTVVTGGVLKIQKSNNTVAIPAALTVTSGTVQILASGQLASTSDIVVGASGTFNFGSASGLSNTFGTFTNSGTFTSGANTFTGTGNSVYLSSGVYTISAGGTVSDGHWNVTGGTNTVQGGASRGTLEVLSGSLGLEFDGTASPTITLNSDAAQAGRMLLSGNVSVLSGLTSGTATIASGGSALNPGYVDLNGGTRTVTVSNGSAATDLLISAAITNGGLTKEGLGTLTLSGVNSYDGVMAINAGVVDLQNTAALGSATSGTSVASGASLQVRGGIALGAEALTLDGSGLSSGGALRNISGDNSASGSVTLGGATRINVDAGSLSLSGALSGAYALSVGGPGRLKLTGASNGSTTTDVDGGATLQVGDGGTTGVLGSSNVTIGSGSTVEFKWLSGTMVTVGNVIGGAGSVVANGGDLSLGGANSYSGMTRVSSGRLEVSGTGQLSGTSSVDIAGGTFLLSGTASDRVNNSAAVSLGGGGGGISKFETSGSVAETLGALTLVGGGGIRVIDFGSGSGSLTFSSLASSGAGVPLQIWNWSGNAWTGGGTDRLIITSGQLGANTNLSDITIFSDSGTTTVRTGEVAWGAGGELVAIPEARSVLGALMLLMPLAWRERRQWWRGAAARMRG